MNYEGQPVIVTYRRLNEKLGKALGKSSETFLESVGQPLESTAGGLESGAPPADTAEEQAQAMGNLAKALQYLEASEKTPGIMVSPDDRFTSLVQSFLAERSVESQKLVPLDEGGLEAQFDEHDILGWAGSLFTWIQKLHPHRWISAPTMIPEVLPNSLRVAILGDWGSGLYGAPVCAQSIERDKKGYGLLLHLGDVYYSGTEGEVRERFLKLWPKVPDAVSRACNSNHEMYTGGHAYFGQSLRRFNQQASYFALQNDHWVLIGLDSAYQEADLAGDQVAWLSKLIGNADGRRVILFSHHQLFSWAEKQNVNLQTRLARLLKEKRIFAWYWGHEHRCMLYQRHPMWGLYGRCIGHSGYPYFRDRFTEGNIVQNGPQGTSWRAVDVKNMVPGGLILEGPNAYIPKHEEEYGPHGYMTLEFSDNQLNEIVHAPDGSIAHQQQLV